MIIERLPSLSTEVVVSPFFLVRLQGLLEGSILSDSSSSDEKSERVTTLGGKREDIVYILWVISEAGKTVPSGGREGVVLRTVALIYRELSRSSKLWSSTTLHVAQPGP